MRKRISDALKDAMKSKDSARLSTVRLINAAIKDRDIAARTDENKDGVSDAEIIEVLAKMIKQRQESAKTYDEAGRIELAEREREEISVISEFLPRQLTEKEVEAAISEAISELNATSIRDMGKIMAELKSKYTGRMDFGKVGAAIKNALA